MIGVGNGRCVVLASGSPRRRELLSLLLASFDIKISGVPEPVDTGRSPTENVLAIARSKAEAIVPRAASCLVLAADTDVVLDDEILGKPEDAAGAVAMLRRLRGREHEVLTAIVLIDATSETTWETLVSSRVLIRNLSNTEIDCYVATGEPLDKAGGYAIQGAGVSMVRRVDGCYTNVVGLPICATRDMLALAGAAIDPAIRCVDADGRLCPR
ncbi:MAG TPA: nucleoside triphosphate pyrophosphatase [Thermomicrobiales bacterium]|nr:nucleoside triphosphate pyrophosphatase [Thermomicrobiales bacterium]